MERSIVFKIIVLVMLLGCTMSDTNEKTIKDIIEHILRVPNREKILNSVIGRLQKNREDRLDEDKQSEDCDYPSEILPEYTEALRESREIGLRQIGAQKHYPICHMERKIKRLNTHEYEYRPAYYEEIKCLSSDYEDEGSSTNEICSSLGFSCVQWNKTIHLTRRRYSSECWETKTMVIPAGCECMWPVHKLGDIKLHV